MLKSIYYLQINISSNDLMLLVFIFFHDFALSNAYFEAKDFNKEKVKQAL